ncbi:hypothetical protein BD779DRAFT_1470970 [Infundibulicybe gibba]|nr:hypothetical protein BD779DRAFT_1470970 [Infundibulicybe gibba]
MVMMDADGNLFRLALTVWDHAITLDSEALYIWSASGLPFVAKAAYISNRSSAISLIPQILRAVVAWEIFNLWERKRMIATLLVVGSMIYIPVLFVVAVECVRGDLKLLFVPPKSTFCGFANSTSPWPKIAYGLIVASDLVVILLVILNAMARPRKTNHDLVFALHRDGAAMYTHTAFGADLRLSHPHFGIGNRACLRHVDKLHDVAPPRQNDDFHQAHHCHLSDGQLSTDDSNCEATGLIVTDYMNV